MNDISKLLIVGTSGSGKSTLARELAAKYHLTDIELDALHWEPQWTPAAPPVFRERIEQAMNQSTGWVVHGNYNKVRDLTWGRADIVIWLDYPLHTILWRITKRSLARAIKREELWSGNRETLRQTFFSKDSMILWALKTYKLRKQQYEALIRDPVHAHLEVIRLKKPGDAAALLTSLGPSL